MKYTKLFLLGFTVLAVMSCRNKSNLEEVVQIAEAEKHRKLNPFMETQLM